MDEPEHGERIDLRQLLALRALAVAGQAATVAVASGVAGISLPVAELTAVIVLLAAFNAAVWWRNRPHYEAGPGIAAGHLAVDVLALTALLYLSGGATNPFVTLFLLPLTIAATTLPASWTWLLTALTAGCYSLVLVVYRPMDWPGAAAAAFDLHVVGMWLAFMLSAGVVAVFVVGMARRLRRRDRALARERERARQDREVVALGSLAANSAHELGNPLATIDLLALELDEQLAAGETLERETVARLRGEVGRCTAVLGRLSRAAGGLGETGGGLLPVDRYVEGLLQQWRREHGRTTIEWACSGPRPGPVIHADQPLRKAIESILDNAAEASPDPLACEARWCDRHLAVAVHDRGSGPPTGTPIPGACVASAKASGLGIGLFLARRVIERFEGSLRLEPRPGGGTTARIEIPLRGLAAGPGA